MEVDQPETSAAASLRPSAYFASFVVDSGISKPRFEELVRPSGLVHKLTERLYEKCGGADNLQLSCLLTARAPKNPRLAPQSYLHIQPPSSPASFLKALPSLAVRFDKDKTEYGPDIIWPSFLPDKGDTPVGHGKGKERLLEGIVGGIEVISSSTSSQPHASSSLLGSIIPPIALPLTSCYTAPYYTPPNTPPPSPSFDPANTCNYLIIIANKSSATTIAGEKLLPTVRQNWDSEWDGLDWDGIAAGCVKRGIRCSCVVFDDLPRMDITAPNLLWGMCQTASGGDADDLWFQSPADTEVFLSGYAVDPETVPPSPMASAAASTMPASVDLQTPVPSTLPDPQAQFIQSQNQAMALRFAQAAQKGSNVDQALLTSLMSAGGSAGQRQAVEQMKQLMQMQQQQKQAQNPGVATTAESLRMNQQVLINAMRQQQQQQTQQQGGTVPPPQAQTSKLPDKFWEGDLLWPSKDSSSAMFTLEALSLGNTSREDLFLHLWPSGESQNSPPQARSDQLVTALRLGGVLNFTGAELREYSVAHSLPYFVLSCKPSPNGDPSGGTKYDQLAKNLYSKGTMARVLFNSPEHGIVIFANPYTTTGPNNEKTQALRLMGLLCQKAPIPKGRPNAAASSSQIPTPPHLLRPALPPQATANMMPNMTAAPTRTHITPDQSRMIFMMAQQANFKLPDGFDPGNCPMEDIKKLMYFLNNKLTQQKQQQQLQQQMLQAQGQVPMAPGIPPVGMQQAMNLNGGVQVPQGYVPMSQGYVTSNLPGQYQQSMYAFVVEDMALHEVRDSASFGPGAPNARGS
ncbi:hypothetical protein P7C73_g3060, partial [Tremellales sp. Uapishka_1]